MTKTKPSAHAAELPMPALGGNYIRRADGTLERLDPIPATPTEPDKPAEPAKEN